MQPSQKNKRWYNNDLVDVDPELKTCKWTLLFDYLFIIVMYAHPGGDTNEWATQARRITFLFIILILPMSLLFLSIYNNNTFAYNTKKNYQ